MTPGPIEREVEAACEDIDRAAEVRRAIVSALAWPCSCDVCPTDEQLLALLDLDDADLLVIVTAARATP